MKKIPLIAGNWKMHKTIEESEEFVSKLSSQITECDALVYLAVPFTAISESVKVAKDSKIVIGAQNMNDAVKGAFTGEIAGVMLEDAGAEFVILGHSERRNSFQETDEFINKKVLRALKDDLQPILCIGEKGEEREAKETEAVLKRQIETGLKGVTAEMAEKGKVVIAYEPVWAIGTGKSATAEIAQKAHHFIRQELTTLFGKDVADKTYILYGGSVKPDNILTLMKETDIDGALIGGAALDLESFLKIIKSF